MRKPLDDEKIDILFLERRDGKNSGIGRVFRQVAEKLNAARFQSEFYEMPYGVNFIGILKNILTYRIEKADVFHITGDIHYLALILPPDKTILTIHDLVLLRLRKGIRRYVLKKLFYDLPVKRMRNITTISEIVKSEIIAETKCSADKIRVIENPLRTIFEKSELREFNAENPRLLQIGTAPNKNLLNTFKGLKGLNCILRIIGKIGSDLQKFLTDSKIQYENVWDLDEREIKNEYFRADIILFCSTYEGFGLPIIEGQAMRKPVITSNLSPMREVAGKGAALVDPLDPTEIRRAVEKIISDKKYRENLLTAGAKNVERFRGEVIARQYEDYYLNILDKNKKR